MRIEEKIKEYLISEKITQPKLRSMFKFLNPELQHRITMDLWQYVNPKTVETGAKIYSTNKSVTDEIIQRMKLDSYGEYVNDPKKIKDLMVKAIRKLNLDVQWEWDKKMKSFIRK